VLANCETRMGSLCRQTSARCTSRTSQYIHAIRLDAAGNMVGRSIFADFNEGSEPGIPDGLKVDSIGRVYCTGPGGIWVKAPDGRRIGVIRWPEQAVNFAVRRAGPADAVLLRARLGLHAARQGARQFTSLIQAARAIISRREQWWCPRAGRRPGMGSTRPKAVVEPCRHAGRAGRHPRLPVVSYGLTV
jgi:hypothetical protein